MDFIRQIGWLFVCSGALTAQAGALSPAELENRRRLVDRAYRTMAEVLQKADQNPELRTYLKRLQFSETTFAKLKSRVLDRVSRPVDEKEIFFRQTNRQDGRCGNGVENKTAVSTTAYTLRADRSIHLCDPFFDPKQDEWSRAATLLHESVHVMEIYDECLTEGVSFFVFLSANRMYRATYLFRCADLKDDVRDSLRKKIDAEKNAFPFPSNESLPTPVLVAKPVRGSGSDQSDWAYVSRDPGLKKLAWFDAKIVVENSRAWKAAQQSKQRQVDEMKPKVLSELNFLKQLGFYCDLLSEKTAIKEKDACIQDIHRRQTEFENRIRLKEQNIELGVRSARIQLENRFYSGLSAYAQQRGIRAIRRTWGKPPSTSSGADVTADLVQLFP